MKELLIVSVLINVIAIVYIVLGETKKRKNKGEDEKRYILLYEQARAFLHEEKYTVALRYFFTLLQLKKDKDIHYEYICALEDNGEFKYCLDEIKEVFSLEDSGEYELTLDDIERLNHIQEIIIAGSEERFVGFTEKALIACASCNYKSAKESLSLALLEKNDFNAHFAYMYVISKMDDPFHASNVGNDIKRLCHSGEYRPDKDQRSKFNSLYGKIESEVKECLV